MLLVSCFLTHNYQVGLPGTVEAHESVEGVPESVWKKVQTVKQGGGGVVELREKVTLWNGFGGDKQGCCVDRDVVFCFLSRLRLLLSLMSLRTRLRRGEGGLREGGVGQLSPDGGSGQVIDWWCSGETRISFWTELLKKMWRRAGEGGLLVNGYEGIFSSDSLASRGVTRCNGLDIPILPQLIFEL